MLLAAAAVAPRQNSRRLDKVLERGLESLAAELADDGIIRIQS